MQNILEQFLKWRFGQRREKMIDERQLFLFALQCEATGTDVQELIAELEDDQASKPDDNNNPPPSDTPATPSDKPDKPRGHGRKRLPRTLTRERI